MPPTLAPGDRAPSANTTSAETRRLIHEHALEVCAVSPHKRDQKRRRVGPRLWITRNALILLMPIDAMYNLFEAKHPRLVKESQYRVEFARECWEAIHAYREGSPSLLFLLTSYVWRIGEALYQSVRR